MPCVRRIDSAVVLAISWWLASQASSLQASSFCSKLKTVEIILHNHHPISVLKSKSSSHGINCTAVKSDMSSHGERKRCWGALTLQYRGLFYSVGLMVTGPIHPQPLPSYSIRAVASLWFLWDPHLMRRSPFCSVSVHLTLR